MLLAYTRYCSSLALYTDQNVSFRAAIIDCALQPLCIKLSIASLTSLNFHSVRTSTSLDVSIGLKLLSKSTGNDTNCLRSIFNLADDLLGILSSDRI